MTIIEQLKLGRKVSSIRIVAEKEKVSEKTIQEGVLSGTIVIPQNNTREVKKLAAVGKGMRTKVNANLGTSPDHISLDEEMEKLQAAVAAGADAIMDLSTGGDVPHIRETLIKHSPLSFGTVPIYQVACETMGRGKTIVDMDAEHMFAVFEQHASQGVDFMTIHCGITRHTVEILKSHKRLGGVVSRGGAFLAKWVEINEKENPLYEHFDRLLTLMKKYDVTLSLGDGLRPGCLADASDEVQMAELATLGDLVVRAREADVQVIVEGPGHMPLDQIVPHVELAKKLIHNAPYYLLGPLVTDVAAGYDHITSAIGGAIAAQAGADFLCYVTPSEHLRLPGVKDVYDGVIASRIAAHAADISKGIPGARQWDDDFSKSRKELNWESMAVRALDPEKFKVERDKQLPVNPHVCTMCGEFCAIRDLHDQKKI